MSEPCDGDTCPFCGSDDTLALTTGTAYRLGFRSECQACQTRWDFPAASDITELHHMGRLYALGDLLAVYQLPAPGGDAP